MVYEREFTAVARLAFGMWNRDPASPSYGSFDRAWWGWKFKDFPDATLQYAARLVVPYAEKQGEGCPLGEWLGAWVRFVASIQHRDGSLDQAYPYERTPGVIFDVLSTFISIYEGPHLSGPARKQLGEVIERAAAFSLATDERHGEIANHIAEYAYELAEYARFSGSMSAAAGANRYLDRLLSLFDREEGWFREYEGADPGYQTRSLRYVVKLAGLPGYEGLWDVAARAGEFLHEFVMPDGSIHPMLGTRSTGLLYPSGIEALAVRHPARFANLATRVRQGWEHGRVPLPSTLDFANAIRLADDAGEASRLMNRELPDVAGPPVGKRSFPRAGLTIWRSAERHVFVSSYLGGVVVSFEPTASGWQLVSEDSGYLLNTAGSAWLTRMPGAGTLVEDDENGLTIHSRFARVLHDELTPLRMVLLRVLNMTVLRSQWLGDVFRRLVVGRLMSNRAWLGASLTRRIDLAPGRLKIVDNVESRDKVVGTLHRCRRLTGAHMASARYFHSSELQSLGEWQISVPWDGHTYRSASRGES
ncbi:MAG: hypothetical protein KA385_02300 [Vicinamibacteria bacterium]|nr:hypothetical protein [Vicinamibacteria bacterium]